MSLQGPEITRLIELLSKLPGMGPRSARRAALHLLKKREQLMRPLGAAISDAAEKVRDCSTCGAPDTMNPCGLCQDPNRDSSILCVVEDASDLWAMERTGAFKGRYHILGGALSALDGIRPEDLRVAGLVGRVESGHVKEVILALSATVDGQTTAHYLTDTLQRPGLNVTRLAAGVPVGSELGYLDDGTILAALAARRPF
ncbi:MAG: recombination mediator RecR [Caulobacterales bacterium]